MNKKRKNIVIWFVMAIVVAAAIGMFIIYRFDQHRNDKYVESAEEGNITRYEWIEMLCDQIGTVESENQIPYFPDVPKENEYFGYVQSAVEWGILDNSSEFEGDGYASGQFIALTFIKAIGENKLRIYFSTEEDITDDFCIKLAIEYGILSEDELVQSFSKKEAEIILEKWNSLYFTEFWKDDIESVKYRDGVIELVSEDVRQCNDDCSKIIVAENTADFLEEGMIIVFEQNNTRLKVAKKVIEIGADGILSLSSVELDEVIESLIVSDITELTFEDIVKYYGLSENIDVISDLRYRQTDGGMINTDVIPFDKSSKGFKLSLATEGEDQDKHLEIQVTDNNTGVSYKLPLSEKVNPDSEYKVEINIDKILVGGQIDYSRRTKINYVDVAIDAHTEFTGTITANEEKKIPLLKMPVSLGNGIAGIEIQIYLVLSLEGDISLKAELPIEMSAYYEDGKGFRSLDHEISVENPAIEVTCEADAIFRPELTFVLFSVFDVLDAEIDAGLTASASSTTRPNSQICIDISVAFPVIIFSICRDDDADTIIGNQGWSMETEIFSADEAPIQIGLHYERLPDGNAGVVDQCTYKKDENAEEKSSNGSAADHTYKTRYGEVNNIDYPMFQFDYSDNWNVIQEEFDQGLCVETVTISNNRGVKITYMDFGSVELDKVGGAGHSWVEVKISKEADSSFASSIPFEIDSADFSPGNFMVAEIKEVRELQTDVDEDWVEVDGNISYAVLPESYAGIHTMNGLAGTYKELSFRYSSTYMFIAEAPDGRFTEGEKEEVIEILASFRVSEDEKGE